MPNSRRIAYLGPAGTFTEQALLTQPDLAGELVPLTTMSDVLFAVHEGDADTGIVAVENAIEGTVNAAVDTLAFDVDLMIQREIVLRVQMNLLGLPGATVDGITTLRSIPVAWAQCRTWVRANLGPVERVPSGSTADAAAVVARDGDPSAAAIANARAAEVYGLEALATDIEDHPENETRFVVVARRGIPAPTGHDKTSIVVFQRADAPGSLLSILQEFAARRINLSLLLSRPTKHRLGDYCFVVDLEGHVADEVVADCLRELKAKQADVRFLGSYPAAGDTDGARRDRASNEQTAAEAWLEALRAQLADGGLGPGRIPPEGHR